MAAPRFFLEEEPALAAQLTDFLGRLAGDFERQPWAARATLVLGGGYGRGEGGVFRLATGAPPALYNDLEFYLFLTGAAPGAAAWVARWEHAGTAEIGIDVEFKILPAAALHAAQPTMFLHDLVAGHHLVRGDPALLAGAPARLHDSAALPLTEVNRLLFNRGSGLLFAAWRLAEPGAVDSAFVIRNHAKARLALADAVLAAGGRHHHSVLERARRIAAGGFPVPAGWPRLRAWHEEGVEFKLRPRHPQGDPAALAAAGTELAQAWIAVFLWIEDRRLGRSFADGKAYADAPAPLFPDTFALRNIALHLRDRLRRGAALPGWADYPRAALLRALVHLLGGGDERGAARHLGVTVPELRTAYRTWWARYN